MINLRHHCCPTKFRVQEINTLKSGILMVSEPNDACNDLAEMSDIFPFRSNSKEKDCGILRPRGRVEVYWWWKTSTWYVLTIFLYGPHHMFDTCITVQWSAWLTHTRPDPPSLEVGFRSCTCVTVLTCSNVVGTPS